MQLIGDKLLFSPSDLITFMDSPYASVMERQRVHNREKFNPFIDHVDPLMERLQQKGIDHEVEYTEDLIAEGWDVLETKKATPKQMSDYTLSAMKSGQELITQGYLVHENFAGHADFLAKIPGASKLGNFHYEVWDTKLSKKIKPYFIIQLCCYSEMLEAIQGVRPERFAIVLGDGEKKYLWVDHYYAYYLSLKKAFLKLHDDFRGQLPNPAGNRNFGRWSNFAKKQLEEQDDLSQVANLRLQQIKNLGKVDIHTMHDLVTSQIDKPCNMSPEIYQKAKKQAALQIESRGLERPKYEVICHDPSIKRGLSLLPPHSDKDVFFDIEGYPAIDGGLEYLWGNTYMDSAGNRQFKDFWAHDSEQEKQIFIEFIDWIYSLWQSDPSMHVYHYASYEITAIRKLMGRYGACEEKVDNLLRNNVFVDLYNIVRNGLVVGEPRYSIKNIEHIYRGTRDTEVASGSESIVVYEKWRENPDGLTWQTSPTLKAIRDYNIDDCDSTQELTLWLREEQSKHGILFNVPDGEGEKEIPDEVTETTQLRDDILLMAQNDTGQRQTSLLETMAWSLEFHKRENKPVWWRLFDRMTWSEVELYEDMDCLAGLARTQTAPFLPTPRARNAVYEYHHDQSQPFKGQGKAFHVLDQESMKVKCYEHRPKEGIISFQYKEQLPTRLTLIPDEYVRPHPIPEAIQSVVSSALTTNFAPCAITDFLARRRPRISCNMEGDIIKDNQQDFLENVVEAVTNLTDSCLCIQGPPGAGKTYTAKHIIGALLKQGKRVGVSSNSHKAILNLMTGVASYIQDNHIGAHLFKVGGNKEDPVFEEGIIKFIPSIKNYRPVDAVCLGGTAWAFCNDSVIDQFDYLFIDEAGQVSVANLIGMSRSCKNIILMGDQMQLGQPIQGSHPGESGMSILDYLLNGKATIPSDMGVFLPQTYRMHPDICSLISKQVYEGKLEAHASTNQHRLKQTGTLITQKSGVCFMPVEHEGNSQASEEEVKIIQDIAKELIGVEYWSDSNEQQRFIGWSDILFVAPYNYQVNQLQIALGKEARVGSIDKFQGQEAPVVILSMCASDASESPRGIDFLFSKNRLNVAISRAQALAIIVGNPHLAGTPAANIRQMEMINFFCEIVKD